MNTTILWFLFPIMEYLGTKVQYDIAFWPSAAMGLTIILIIGAVIIIIIIAAVKLLRIFKKNRTK